MNPYLELLVRASLLILTGLLLWSMARNRSAESRVTLLRLTVLGLAILPAIWALGPRWAFNIPGMAKPDPILVNFDLDVLSYSTALPTSRVDILPWVYLGIALLVLVPAVVGHFVLQRLWRQAMPLGWRLEDELSEALDTVGVRQIVEGRKGPISSPFVFGVIRRFILLPANFEEWPEEHRRSALLHEAAHLKRFDCAWQHLAHGVRAVYWCHPLVWFLSRALKDETELAADERAIRSGAEAADYASALVAIARTLQEPGRLVRSQGVTFMNHRQLDRRVRSVLHGRRRGFTSIGGLIMAAFAAVGTYVAAGANPQKPQPEIIALPPQQAVRGQEIPVVVTGPIGTPIPLQIQEVRVVAGQSTKGVTTVTTPAGQTVKVASGQAAAAPRAVTVTAKPGVAITTRALPAKATVVDAQGRAIAPRAVEVQGVPFLKDLPLVGRLFQTTREGQPVPATVIAPTQTPAPLGTTVGSPAIVQGGLTRATTIAPRGEAVAAPLMHLQGGRTLSGTTANIQSLLVTQGGKVSEADLARALELLSRMEKDHKSDVAELRRLLENAGAAKKASAFQEYFRLNRASTDQANAFKDKFQQEWIRDQFNEVQKLDKKSADDAKRSAADAFQLYRGTIDRAKVAAPLTWQRDPLSKPVEGMLRYNYDVAPLATRHFNVATGSTKPVTIKISVDGKMHELKVSPDKEGNVVIEVDANGKVRVVGGK